MLERFALAAAFNQFAIGICFFFRQRALEIQVQFHAWHFKAMREEEFGLQARRFDAAFGEEVGAALDRFQDGHAETLNRKHRWDSILLLDSIMGVND